MVHWRHLPIALSPSEPYDEYGVFTGSAFMHPTRLEPALIFTGNTLDHEVQNFAYPDNSSDPDLVKWHKDPRNPILKFPFGRDPTQLRPGVAEGDWFFQFGGSVANKGVVRIASAKNHDLYNWTDEGIFFGPVENIPGNFFECPDRECFSETELCKYVAYLLFSIQCSASMRITSMASRSARLALTIGLLDVYQQT
jgi:beta-fructofuranosidase